MLNAIIHIRSYAAIAKQFEKIFKKTIDNKYISYFYNSKKYKPLLAKIREDYDKELQKEFFASPRSRLRGFSNLYDIAIERNNLNIACESLKAMEHMMTKENKTGDIHFTYFQQNNRFANMTIPQIKNEIARLCKMKIHDSVELSTQEGTNGLGIEDAQTIEEIKTTEEEGLRDEQV